MAKDKTICFRMDKSTEQRIHRVLGPRHSTRSRFIRTAIEQLLLKEEGQMRSQAALPMIQWG